MANGSPNISDIQKSIKKRKLDILPQEIKTEDKDHQDYKINLVKC